MGKGSTRLFPREEELDAPAAPAATAAKKPGVNVDNEEMKVNKSTNKKGATRPTRESTPPTGDADAIPKFNAHKKGKPLRDLIL
jgi:hypothetical protein